MWKLVPIKIKYGLPAALSILLYLIYNGLFHLEIIKSISYTVSTLTFLAWLFGKHLWKYCYCDFFKKHFCPDFNGKWIASVSSNHNGATLVEFPVHIDADFFSIKMKGETTIGRTYADYCRVVRTEDDGFELVYMFKVINDTPSDTDTYFYEGAARLRVIDIKSMHMRGVFWTNRCWQNGKNTAGTITFAKVF
ncbi:hypothetical protein [Cronobacter sakazakii]|uniref:hypothetical protein n=1 Tax=Cronobacter sakazakii TaxID=28141 RepID=UPI0029CA49D3|nr:hypothetical protein [Cronobacter sakazakii]MDK1262742.1 hypothetical protein [Cronobacter sakazakii]